MMRMMSVVCLTLLAIGVNAAEPQPVNLVFEDQLDNKPELASLRGKVAVLVFGDRKATDACREFGQALHIAFHPTAKGLSPSEAAKQPVIALSGAKVSPDVAVVPVATCGKVPSVVRTVIRAQIKKGAPDVPVWLDFEETMVKHFGQTSGEVNVAVFDTKGRYRHVANGTLDAKKQSQLLQLIQDLRVEATRP
jgi:hypothetical protein